MYLCGCRWFDLVIVLQTDNTVLWERLEKRGYVLHKIQENIECEIMNVVVEEARESYAEEIVHILTSNDVDEMEKNVDNIVTWVRQWQPPQQ
jgi:adenylate kinase